MGIERYRVFSKSKNSESKEKIIELMLPKIKWLALSIVKDLPKNVDVDDLIQEGVIGLLNALENYDPTKGASIVTYAMKRVRGAMYDYLRKIDWMPRGVRKKVKEVEEAILVLEGKLQRIPDDKEIAEYLNMEEKDVRNIKNEMARRQIFSLDSYLLDDSEDSLIEHVESDELNPEQEYEKKEVLEALKKSISKLSEREQLVISLYYIEELNFKEIGKVLNVSESRISQIHSAALIKIKNYMKEFFGSDSNETR